MFLINTASLVRNKLLICKENNIQPSELDRMAFFEDGKIVGEGTHKELLKTCKIYKEIALSQLTEEELENE